MTLSPVIGLSDTPAATTTGMMSNPIPTIAPNLPTRFFIDIASINWFVWFVLCI
jgi:hypothetical protein